MLVDTALDNGLVVRGNSLDIYSENPDGGDKTPLAWSPDPTSPLYEWLVQGNHFWAVKAGQVRVKALGKERIRVPRHLVDSVKEDGAGRVWEQGGYTFGVSLHDGSVKVALVGIPEGGNSVDAWVQEVTLSGIGSTFLEALGDAFTDEVAPS